MAKEATYAETKSFETRWYRAAKTLQELHTTGHKMGLLRKRLVFTAGLKGIK